MRYHFSRGERSAPAGVVTRSIRTIIDAWRGSHGTIDAWQVGAPDYADRSSRPRQVGPLQRLRPNAVRRGPLPLYSLQSGINFRLLAALYRTPPRHGRAQDRRCGRQRVSQSRRAYRNADRRSCGPVCGRVYHRSGQDIETPARSCAVSGLDHRHFTAPSTAMPISYAIPSSTQICRT